MLIGQPVFAVRTGIQAVVRHDIIPYPLESFSDKLVVGVTLRVRKTALINVIEKNLNTGLYQMQRCGFKWLNKPL